MVTLHSSLRTRPEILKLWWSNVVMMMTWTKLKSWRSPKWSCQISSLSKPLCTKVLKKSRCSQMSRSWYSIRKNMHSLMIKCWTKSVMSSRTWTCRSRRSNSRLIIIPCSKQEISLMLNPLRLMNRHVCKANSKAVLCPKRILMKKTKFWITGTKINLRELRN